MKKLKILDGNLKPKRSLCDKKCIFYLLYMWKIDNKGNNVDVSIKFYIGQD